MAVGVVVVAYGAGWCQLWRTQGRASCLKLANLDETS